MVVIINGVRFIRDKHTLKLMRIGKEYKEMITEKEIKENNYKYYLLYRELGYKEVQIKGFEYLYDMFNFINSKIETIIKLEVMSTFNYVGGVTNAIQI